MHVAMSPLPHMPSWCGASFITGTNLSLHFCLCGHASALSVLDLIDMFPVVNAGPGAVSCLFFHSIACVKG
jgi:hypothetical protein